MNLSFLLQDLISWAVIGLISFLWRWINRFIKSTVEDVPVEERMPKQKLHRQFLIWLFGLLLSTIVFFNIDGNTSSVPLYLIKAFAGISVLLSFIFVWGAFDTAFVFYPSDEKQANCLTDKPANDGCDDS